MQDPDRRGRSGAPLDVREPDPTHIAAYLRAFELVVEVQSDQPDAATAIQSLLDEAVRRDWPDVVRAALFAAIVSATTIHDGQRLSAVQRLLARAESDESPVMTALALSMRADRRSVETDPELAISADDDLARATVLLESGEGTLLERISAHNSCATAYADRWLWELADEQYALAMALAPSAPAQWTRLVLPAITYNRAEMQVNWACVLHQMGDVAGLAERRRAWDAALTPAHADEMPGPWAVELEALGTLLAAICGEDVVGPARDRLASVEAGYRGAAWPAGWLQLAVAVCEQRTGHPAEAAAAASAAVDGIDPRRSSDCHDLALLITAELESGDGSSNAIRYARRQLALRWALRRAALGSMRGRLQAEQLRRDNELVIRQAYRDDLTGLLNRRGFTRYLEATERQQVGVIALLIADIDGFKAVNDRRGHAVGDAALVTLGRLLEAHVRQADCAVRLGGDEFAVVLAGAELEVAARRAAALVAAVHQQEWGEPGDDLTISVSVGLATGKPSDVSLVLGRADEALYHAKAYARGGVVCYTDDGKLQVVLAPGDARTWT